MHLRFENLCPNIFMDQPLNSQIWNTSFEIKTQDRLLLYAPSGRGKTSLIYFLVGLRADYVGDIFVNDRNIKSLSIADWTEIRRLKFSMVYQDLQLFERLTVKENIAMLPEFAENFDLDTAKELLHFLGIGEKWESITGTLSFGQKQRVAIVRSVMKPFQFLICDEPFSHLDSKNTTKCIQLIERRINEENAGLIISGLEDHSMSHGIKTIHL